MNEADSQKCYFFNGCAMACSSSRWWFPDVFDVSNRLKFAAGSFKHQPLPCVQAPEERLKENVCQLCPEMCDRSVSTKWPRSYLLAVPGRVCRETCPDFCRTANTLWVEDERILKRQSWVYGVVLLFRGGTRCLKHHRFLISLWKHQATMISLNRRLHSYGEKRDFWSFFICFCTGLAKNFF